MAPLALKPETREMAVQTELEYTSTGVGPLPLQYTSIAVGSPVLNYSHTSVGTTPEPEPMSLVSSPREPPTTQQTTILEAPRTPTPEPPTVPPPETEPSASEVASLSPECFVFSDGHFVASATKPLTHGNEFHTI